LLPGFTYKMKRIQLFEFEDFSWFPDGLRECMTRFIMAMHRLLGTKEELAVLISRALLHSKEKKIIDLCSGSGGPMLEVRKILEDKYDYKNLELTLSDLYPHPTMAALINNLGDPNLSYLNTPVDAANIPNDQQGVRTMICSMHHMSPDVARKILKDAEDKQQPICVFEISDNSFPRGIWWIAFPINIITTLLITPLVRPMTWQQIVFTYLIPVLPILIAWDGAVSNARTYTMNDLDILLEGMGSDRYQWEKDTIKGKPGNKIYLMGLPKDRLDAG